MTKLWSWPWKSAEFSWNQYGVGWACTFVSFVVFLSLISIPQPGMPVVVLIFGFIYGFIPALLIGYPLGILIAGFFTRCTKLSQQLLGFFIGLAGATMLISQLFGPLWQHFEYLGAQLIASALVGCAGLIGRLAAWYVPPTRSTPTREISH